ncbi:MAG TPA: hypothetical protein VF618_08410 [Thermoanaerobaculia bacterium]
MSIRANLRDGSYEWLAAILLSWWIPFQLFGEFHVQYWVSLLLWIVPIAFLLPRFLRETHRGSRRRQALLASAGYIFIAGLILDFAFGAAILRFDKCPPGTAYLRCLRAIGGEIPIEEYLFYILGGLAVVLVYVWADMHWLSGYNVHQRQGLIPAPGHLIELSPRVAIVATLTLGAGIAWRVYYETLGPKTLQAWTRAIPFYYTFLVLFAFLPLILMYRAVMDFVNWRAFSLTGLYVLLTSAIWEITLGLPNCWWCYQDKAMIGKYIRAWSFKEQYPIEALLVWIAVVFVGVFFYEFWETYFYDPRPPLQKLFTGTFPPSPPPPPPPVSIGISVIARGSSDLDDRVRRLKPAMESGMLDHSAFEIVVSANTPEWRSAGAELARYPTLCFLDATLTAAPRVFRMIRDVLESPRIVGGSTTVVFTGPIGARIRHLVQRPKAWITAVDCGVAFCRRVDFEALTKTEQAADQDDFLRGLRRLGKESRRVLTRLTTDGVTERTHPFND